MVRDLEGNNLESGKRVMIKPMQLFETGKKDIRVGVDGPTRAKSFNPQVIGKMLATKLVNANGLIHDIGRI